MGSRGINFDLLCKQNLKIDLEGPKKPNGPLGLPPGWSGNNRNNQHTYSNNIFLHKHTHSCTHSFTCSLLSITVKNTDFYTWPLAYPFAHSLAPLTRSLIQDYSLRSHFPLRSLIRSLAHFAHFLTCGTVNDWMAILSVYFSIFNHSVAPRCSLRSCIPLCSLTSLFALGKVNR